MGIERLLSRVAWSGVLWGLGIVSATGAAEPVGPDHPHSEIACMSCHLGEQAADPIARRNEACLSCHADKPARIAGPTSLVARFERERVLASNAATGTAPTARRAAEEETTDLSDRAFTCVDCHSFHEPARIAPAGVPMDLTDDRITNHCSACHSHGNDLARLTEGHVAASGLYHSLGDELAELSPSEACLICHDRGGRVPDVVPAHMPVIPRFDAHESHPYGIPMPGSGDFFRSVIDPRLPLPGGRIECQTCHDLTAQNEDLVIPFEAKYDLCHGCHTQGLPRDVRAGLAQR